MKTYKRTLFFSDKEREGTEQYQEVFEQVVGQEEPETEVKVEIHDVDERSKVIKSMI